MLVDGYYGKYLSRLHERLGEARPNVSRALRHRAGITRVRDELEREVPDRRRGTGIRAAAWPDGLPRGRHVESAMTRQRSCELFSIV